MKRTILFIMIAFAFNLAHAQRGEVRRAERQLNRGNLIEAKIHIDAASADASTKEEAATWLLKAKIYMEIYLSDEPEHIIISDNPLAVAEQAARKALELNPTNIELIQIQQSLIVLSELVYNEGIDAFNEDDFLSASANFMRAYKLGQLFEDQDTTTLYNAGLAAEMGLFYDQAYPIYTELLEMEYDQPFLYTSLGTIAMAQGDTLKALDYIRQGRERYPDDLNIIFSEANVYIFTGDVERARDVLALAIEKDPDNKNLYFALAANFDRMVQDTTYAEQDRRTFFLEAEKRYRQAIEIDENYFDAIFNLGVLYFNEGIRIYEEADARLRATQDFRRYEEDEKMFIQAWLRSQPYLERAKELLTEDDEFYETVIISLLQLYARTNQPEKMQEVERIYRQITGYSEEEE